MDEPPEKGSYINTPMHSETSLLNRTNLNTTSLFYVVPCISIHCKSLTEHYYADDVLLKCNIRRYGISLSSINTFSPVFTTTRIEIKSIKACPQACRTGSQTCGNPCSMGSASRLVVAHMTLGTN